MFRSPWCIAASFCLVALCLVALAFVRAEEPAASTSTEGISVHVLAGVDGKPLARAHLLLLGGYTPEDLKRQSWREEAIADDHGQVTVSKQLSSFPYLQVWVMGNKTCQNNPRNELYSVGHIRQNGLSTPNRCGILNITNQPGVFLVFVQGSVKMPKYKAPKTNHKPGRSILKLGLGHKRDNGKPQKVKPTLPLNPVTDVSAPAAATTVISAPTPPVSSISAPVRTPAEVSVVAPASSTTITPPPPVQLNAVPTASSQKEEITTAVSAKPEHTTVAVPPVEVPVTKTPEAVAKTTESTEEDPYRIPDTLRPMQDVHPTWESDNLRNRLATEALAAKPAQSHPVRRRAVAKPAACKVNPETAPAKAPAKPASPASTPQGGKPISAPASAPAGKPSAGIPAQDTKKK